jgi:hypothetical protein
MAFDQGQQRQLAGIASGVVGGEPQFLVSWTIKRLEFGGRQSGFKTRIGGAIDGSHRRGISSEGRPKKGSPIGPNHPLILQEISSIKGCPKKYIFLDNTARREKAP